MPAKKKTQFPPSIDKDLALLREMAVHVQQLGASLIEAIDRVREGAAILDPVPPSATVEYCLPRLDILRWGKPEIHIGETKWYLLRYLLKHRQATFQELRSFVYRKTESKKRDRSIINDCSKLNGHMRQIAMPCTIFTGHGIGMPAKGAWIIG